MMDSTRWRRLVHYIFDESTPAETEDTWAWLVRDTEARREARLLATIRAIGQRKPRGTPDVDRAWKGLERDVIPGVRSRTWRDEHRPRMQLSPFDSESRSGTRARRIRLVLGTLGALAAGAMIWVLQSSSPQRSGPAVTYRDYATQRGQRAEIRLSDGTRVVLAPASRLRVPDNYERGRRELYLEGAALFTVQHDSTQRFIVHTARGTAEDLGTEFTVKAYPTDTALEVAVVKGRVAVGPTDSVSQPAAEPTTHDVTIVSAGQVGHVASDGIVHVDSDVAMNGYVGWTRGVLRFDRVPLSAVLVDLQRWYGIDISLADSSLAAVPVTAEFKDGSADDAMRALALLLDIKFQRSGRSVRLFGLQRP